MQLGLTALGELAEAPDVGSLSTSRLHRIAPCAKVQTGLWHWEAPHPEWGPGNSSLEWDRQEVSSYAIGDGDRLLLFDPLALPSEVEELAAGRDTAIVLTRPWHERDARSLVERLDAAVFVPQSEEGDPIEGRLLFSAGDRLSVGVDAFPGRSPTTSCYGSRVAARSSPVTR